MPLGIVEGPWLAKYHGKLEDHFNEAGEPPYHCFKSFVDAHPRLKKVSAKSQRRLIINVTGDYEACW
jgi:hypothetical protein